jgi:hypothetical protein
LWLRLSRPVAERHHTARQKLQSQTSFSSKAADMAQLALLRTPAGSGLIAQGQQAHQHTMSACALQCELAGLRCQDTHTNPTHQPTHTSAPG